MRAFASFARDALIGVMETLKRTASSPPNKDGKRLRDEDCALCCNPATDSVIECLWCEARLHAKCAKLSEEQCILIGNATRNVVFFCTPCLEALPEAFKSYDGFSLVDSRVSTIEKSISDMQTSTLQGLKAELTTLQTITSNLATKVKDLCTQNTTLQEQLQVVSSDLTTKSTSSLSDSDAASSTFDVANEIAERDRRKRNIIVYNLPEKTERVADKVKFTEMCKEITDVELKITKTFRLGKRVESKHRPLLVGLETEDDKACLLSVAPRLRLSTEFKQVFIALDMTKLERERHKKVVEELKRRSNGESGIFIRNGNIVQRRSHPKTMQHSTVAAAPAESSSRPSGQSNQSS